MKFTTAIVLLLLGSYILRAQTPGHIRDIFPSSTVIHANVPYANDTVKKHLLDIYLPANITSAAPLIIWVHGGGWSMNDKYADMSYMKKTIRRFLENGYALASIDYRHSTTEKFPAQMIDCFQAVQFLHEHAAKYKLDRSRFVLAGFSAGGHLGSLVGLSLNNSPEKIFPGVRKPSFNIRGVLDFYGPSDLLMFYGNAVPGPDNSPIAVLLGASPLLRPDLSKIASPVSYVDRDDPPFLIIHGELDNAVPPTQSHLLKSYLDLSGVKNEIMIVKGAPHFGEMFDADEVQTEIFRFLKDLR